MYARDENGTVKKYQKIPSKFKGITGNYAGGFDKLSSEIHLTEGFKPIVDPVIDRPKINKLGDLIEEAERFIYDVVSIYPNITIEEARAKIIKQVKDIAAEKFSESQWYYDRECRTDKIKDKTAKKVPEEILAADGLIYTSVDNIEADIIALSDINAILEFEIKL